MIQPDIWETLSFRTYKKEKQDKNTVEEYTRMVAFYFLRGYSYCRIPLIDAALF
jgi:hypothetical protein